jgi:UDP-2-acetamido-2,6-beta-L-arabino-hexul-4-ose reductase
MADVKSRILITGANGFIGKNLVVRLNELHGFTYTTFVRGDDVSMLSALVAKVDAVIHLAGESRPLDQTAFDQVNKGLTATLCDAIRFEYFNKGRHVPLVLASSRQAEQDNPYGVSKLASECVVQALAKETGNPCIIFRLPGVFGKWCKPNYNSVVATFCYNIARELPIQISDTETSLELVYIDDVVAALLSALDSPALGSAQVNIKPEYTISLGELAIQIQAFANCRSLLLIDRVGNGFLRALYATYISYLPNEKFSYKLTMHTDQRGVFVEMLKTSDSGQFSFFSAHPGVTRGGHYHHTKTEKFLVVKGEALFRFKHLISNELVEIKTSDSIPQVVDTIPGWSHDITNIGNNEMVVLLWASENFDRKNMDTIVNNI